MIFKLYDDKKDISARGIPFESPPLVRPVPTWHFESIDYIQKTVRIKQLGFSAITRALILKCFVYSLEDRERDLHGGVCTRHSETLGDTKTRYLTILFIVLSGNRLDGKLDFFVRDFVTVQDLLQEPQGFGSK
jgi:hypothetical protein